MRTESSVTLGIGGSILAPPDLQPDVMISFAERLIGWSRNRKIFVVVGGGAVARRYIEAAREAGVDERMLDEIGIQATRLNAKTLSCIVRKLDGNVNAVIPHSVADALTESASHDIIVMGGTVPGHSTDYVSAKLAIDSGCSHLVNVTNVDGVYTRDPKAHREAEFKPDLSFREMLDIIGDPTWTTAGKSGALDGPAAVLIAENKLPTFVVNGHDLDNLDLAMEGKNFHGTRIVEATVEA